jgi:UDP-2-acetamido-2-deoxy-ribo-hexuluronate aminotransferase
MIQFVDLKAQFRVLEPEIRARINAVLEHSQFILGPEVKELEEKLASFVGVKHAITCASGTDALFMALMAKGIGPGHVIFTTPFTFFASAEAIALTGATPVFVDVDPRTFNMDPKKLAAAIAANHHGTAKGIIAVDIFGLCSDYDPIHSIARDYGLWVIEDAAQSFGADYKGRRSCSLAELTCTSFFPAKPLGCYGDGGALFTDSDDLHEKLVSIRVHGQGRDRYEHVRLGITGRLDSLQAAVLLAKLSVFEKELRERQRVADRYNDLIARHVPTLVTPFVPTGYQSAWAQYCVLAQSSDQRQKLRDKLQAAGVPTAVYYPIPLHLQKVFGGLGYHPGDMPVSEDLATRIFALPMHPYLTNEAIETIVTAMRG